jgi:polyhydroxyalkanoate synthesis regulator phasin
MASKKSQAIATFVSKRINCDYIPAIRTAESAQRIVEELVERELTIAESDPQFQEAMKKIEEIQKPILQKLEDRIQSTLVQFLPSIKKVTFEVETERRYRAMRRSCDIIVDDGTPTTLEYKGDGVQSLAALGIMRHASESRGQGKRRDKTGWELRMKESYREGLASRSGPESYAGGGNIAGVATAGVRAGQPLSSEITHLACRPRPDKGKATSTLALLASRRRTRRSLRTWACAETSIARTGRSWELPWGAVRPHQRGTVGERHRR